MQLKKSLLTMAAISVGAFTIFLGIQLADAKKTDHQNEEAAKALLKDGLQAGMPPKASAETEKLNQLHREIVAMSNEQIMAEFTRLNESARSDSVLASENAGDVNLSHHPEKKEMLIRLALLRAERNRRGLVIRGATKQP